MKENASGKINNQNIKKLIIQIFMLSLGALLYALSIALFLDPNNLAPGGVTGISIILNKIIGVKTGTLILIINIPILIFGWWKFGTKFIISTVYVIFSSSMLVNIFVDKIVNVYGPVSDDLLLCGVFGGAIMAMGIAIVFRNGSTTGGTDIIVKALRQKYKHIKTGTLFMSTDGFIILSSALIFKSVDLALNATITLIVSNMVLDKLLYGGDSAKLLYIISEKSDIIAKRIMEEIDIGVTFLNAKGAYTDKDKEVIMCVCRRYNYTRIREIVKEEDVNSFFIVSSASDVFGDGYKSHTSEEI